MTVNISATKVVVTSFIIVFAIMKPFKHAYFPFGDILPGRNARK